MLKKDDIFTDLYPPAGVLKDADLIVENVGETLQKVIARVNSQTGKSAQGHLFEIRSAAHLTEQGHIITDMAHFDGLHIDQVGGTIAYQSKRTHDSLLWRGGFPKDPDYKKIRTYLEEAIENAKQKGLTGFQLVFPDFVPHTIAEETPELKELLLKICFEGDPCVGRSLWDRIVEVPNFMTAADMKAMELIEQESR